MESNQIVVSSATIAPTANYRQASEVAGLCKELVTKTAQNISGRRYVRVEGWQAIAVAHGCVASARDVERVDGGYRCIGEVRRMDNGQVIATAEGFLGDDEPTWAKRPEYARRAMCQTRSISRACRSAFAHVVVLMDAGLETVPAEEVPQEGFAEHRNGNGHAPRLIDEPAVEIIQPRIVSRELVSGKTTYAEPAPKKKPVAAPREAADFETVTFLKRSRKEGQSAKGKWTRWGMLARMSDGSEQWLNTFAGEYGELIDAASEGDSFNVELKRGERGVDIVDMLPGDVPTKAEAQIAAKDIEWGTKEEADDSVPF